MAGFDNDVCYANNLDFRGVEPVQGQVTLDGQLLIGATSSPNIRVGDLQPPAAGIAYTYSQPTSETARITTSLTNDLEAVENLATTGLSTRTAADTWTTRQIEVTANTGLAITNADGVSGNPNMAGIDASSTVKGVSTYDANDFTVTSGNVAISNRDRLIPNYVQNIGISYNAGTFTIQGADGTALSASNVGYVLIPSKANPGRWVKVQVTANQTFVDSSGSSTIIGNNIGLTSGIAHSQLIPFWIYAVLNDAETDVSFMISRYDAANTSPPTAIIGKTGSAVANSQRAFFALGNPTVTDYDQNPCINIGAFRMNMNVSTDWLLALGLQNQDGIGRYLLGEPFLVSPSQFGAASGKYFRDNGGTAPGFSGNSFFYWFESLSGIVHYNCVFATATVVGLGAVSLQLASPYVFSVLGIKGSGYSGALGGVSNSLHATITVSATNLVVLAAIPANRIFQNSDMIATSDLTFSGWGFLN